MGFVAGALSFYPHGTHEGGGPHTLTTEENGLSEDINEPLHMA